MNLELYRPAVHDLWFKWDLLADEATMSYNRAWGGTVDFPEDLWGRWHDALVAREGEGRRFYRYLRDLDAGEFVGEVAYRWDPDYDSFITHMLVHARFRGRWARAPLRRGPRARRRDAARQRRPGQPGYRSLPASRLRRGVAQR